MNFKLTNIFSDFHNFKLNIVSDHKWLKHYLLNTDINNNFSMKYV